MKEKMVNLLGIRKNGVILCRSNNNHENKIVIMEAIIEEQEEKIDNSKKYFGEIRYERKDNRIIKINDIYMYGEINFDNKDDVELIKKLDLVDNNHNWIWSNFDYEKGCFTTIEGKQKGYDTWDSLKWFKYNHCLLGKPKRIIVYKYPNINNYGNR